MIKAKRLGHATFETTDVERAIDYYTNVVGLRVGAVPSMDGGLAEDYPLQTAVPQIALARDGTLYVADTVVALAISDGIARVVTRVSAVNGRNTPEGANAKGQPKLGDLLFGVAPHQPCSGGGTRSR